MTERSSRKPSRKRASKKYPKIVVEQGSVDALVAAYNLTPAELRRARRTIDALRKRSSTAAK